MFQSPSFLFSSNDSDTVKIIKVSESIKKNIGKRNLFCNTRVEGPRLRKSAILRCFNEVAASTPISNNPATKNNDCFISPITPNESIKQISKRKSKASLKNAVKAFNDKIKEESKIISRQKSASAQVNDVINESKIHEILKVDACTTEKLQTSLFKKRSGSLKTENRGKTRASNYKTQQTQTSNSLNASRQKSNQSNPTNETQQTQTSNSLNASHRKSNQSNPTNEVELFVPLESGVENSVNTINSLHDAKEDFVDGIILISDDSNVLEANNLEGHETNQLEEVLANESIILSTLSVKEDNTEPSSVTPQTVTGNNNEAMISSIEKLLVLSHLNIETELKEIEIEQKVKEKVTISGRIAMQRTPLRERLRSRNISGNRTNRSTILPRLATNKRKITEEVECNKPKKQSPEIPPLLTKIYSKDLVSEQNEITKSPEELSVQTKGSRKKNNSKRITRVTRAMLKKSEVHALPESLQNRKNSQDQNSETLKLQLSQLENFSPCVLPEKIEIPTSNRVQTRSQTKMNSLQNSLRPESSANGTNQTNLHESEMDIPDTRDENKKTINLYQYVIHRKSGFYQLPDEPITAASMQGGRPKRIRRRPKQFIQAAFIPELPVIRRTTNFKPEKIEVKNQVRKGYQKPKEAPSFDYNLRNSAIRSENVTKGPSCTPESKENKKKKDRIRKPLQNLTENVNTINSCMEQNVQKKKVVKRLQYDNGLQNTGDTMLPEESACNVNLLFDQSQICISDDTITGIERIREKENKQDEIAEEDSNFQCLINNQFVDVKCYSKMPLFEGNGKQPITGISVMVNQSQNSEVTLGYIKIQPNKKLFVAVNKYLFTSYTVIKGRGVSKIENRVFPIKEGSIIYVPLGMSYYIHNSDSLPLILQYTINAKIS